MTSTRTRLSSAAVMSFSLLVTRIRLSLPRRLSQVCAVSSHWERVAGGTVTTAHAPPPTSSSMAAMSWKKVAVLPVPAS